MAAAISDEQAFQLISDGVLEGPGLFTFVMGVRYAMPFSTSALTCAKSLIRPGAQWSAFGIGRSAFPAVAQAYLLGGNVGIGLEDTIYLSKGELAKGNGALVSKARRIVEDLGGVPATADQARQRWGLRATNAATTEQTNAARSESFIEHSGVATKAEAGPAPACHSPEI